MIPLAGPANRQGRIAANNMMGEKRKVSRNSWIPLLPKYLI